MPRDLFWERIGRTPESELRRSAALGDWMVDVLGARPFGSMTGAQRILGTILPRPRAMTRWWIRYQ